MLLQGQGGRVSGGHAPPCAPVDPPPPPPAAAYDEHGAPPSTLRPLWLLLLLPLHAPAPRPCAGGFYDHQPNPSEGVPAPDDVPGACPQSPSPSLLHSRPLYMPPSLAAGENGFDFSRLGVRVVTLAVSPWVAKGAVIHKPTGVRACGGHSSCPPPHPPPPPACPPPPPLLQPQARFPTSEFDASACP